MKKELGLEKTEWAKHLRNTNKGKNSKRFWSKKRRKALKKIDN